MSIPSIRTRNHLLTIDGVNPQIRTNFIVKQNRLTTDGLISYEGSTTLQRMTDDNLEFDIRYDTDGHWNIGNLLGLQIDNEFDVLTSPYWFQNLRILKIPKSNKRERSLNIQFGSDLVFYDRETPEGDGSQVDPAVGLPRNQVILNLLRMGIPNATLIAAPGSSLPTEVIRYPIDKNDRISYIEQAGMLAFNSQAGPGYIYQSGAAQFSFFYYADAIATPALSLSFQDVVNDPDLIQPEEFVSPVEKLKVTGVKVDVLDINTTPNSCQTTFKPFTLPDGRTFQRKTLEVCTKTTVDSTGLIFTTTYTKASILPGLLALDIVKSGEDFKIGTKIVTTDTYSAIDGLLQKRDIIEERNYIVIVNGNIISSELKPYIRETTSYVYDSNKLLTRTETDYFHPTAFTITGGLTLYDIFQNPTAQIADPYAFVGTVIESWVEEANVGFVHTVSLVLNANGTLNPARPTREYFITFNPPGRTIGLRDSQQPPEAETVPLPYNIKQKNIEKECIVKPLFGAVSTERERVINIRHVHSESQLQKVVDFLCGMQWSRALASDFILPLYDELTTGIPIKRIDYTDELGRIGAFLFEAPSFLLSRDSCVIEVEMPFLGSVSGGVITPPIQQQFKLPVLHETIDSIQDWTNVSSTFDDYLCISTAFAQT